MVLCSYLDDTDCIWVDVCDKRFKDVVKAFNRYISEHGIDIHNLEEEEWEELWVKAVGKDNREYVAEKVFEVSECYETCAIRNDGKVDASPMITSTGKVWCRCHEPVKVDWGIPEVSDS